MSQTTPYSLLSDLAERARATSIDLPPEQSAQTHSTGLGFSLLGQRFVASMDEVNELMRVPQTTRVPGVKNFVLGVGNVRGRLMTIIDLALFFGQASKLPKAQRRLLAVEDDENLIGFVIDESLGMQHFPADAYLADADEVDQTFTSIVKGSYLIAGAQWPLLSLVALKAEPGLEKLSVAH